jgi:poly-beta-hydroxybutyrate-responsive repressor
MHIVTLGVKPLLERKCPKKLIKPEYTISMAKRENDGTYTGPRLHGELLATSLLGFLRDWSAHGYQLAQRLADAGLPPFDVGTIYRTLRQLERSGLVSSAWDTSASGPARRTYSLTNAGEAFLNTWVDMLQRYQRIFQPPPPKRTRSADDA